jgi:hypothetical protein
VFLDVTSEQRIKVKGATLHLSSGYVIELSLSSTATESQATIVICTAVSNQDERIFAVQSF